MTIDLKTEKLYPLSKAAKLFPGGGKHVSQLHRYRLGDGSGIKLECAMCGGRLATSIEAMHRFIEAKTNAMDNEVATPPVRVSAAKSRRDDRYAKAERSLAAAGV